MPKSSQNSNKNNNTNRFSLSLKGVETYKNSLALCTAKHLYRTCLLRHEKEPFVHKSKRIKEMKESRKK